MARHYDDWLTAFLEYSSYGEAPTRMYFWVGVSTIAGALRRHVWIDQVYFRWYPNMYIILVAPPGIVSKTTTTGIGINLLRKVPNIAFGPEVVTWESLVQDFACAAETFEVDGESLVQSALTIESGEFGNLFDPKDRKMVDIFVTLWDSKDGKFEKKTKMSGNDCVVNPWINLIACTTPSWISENFSRYLIGGGFTSRTVFVYADEKQNYVAYPREIAPSREALRDMRQRLIEDLEHISMALLGEYVLTPEAVKWGTEWYHDHYTNQIRKFDATVFGGYVARKQTHMHKLAMILAAAQSDDLWITTDHLKTAAQMLTDLEPDMHKVFSGIGKHETALNVDKLINLVKRSGTGISYSEAYSQVHMYFPSAREYEDVLAGAIRSGLIRLATKDGKQMLFPGPNLT